MNRRITASTRLTLVVGDPVRHSLSPALHNAAYLAADLDWVMLAMPGPVGSGAALVDLVRRHEVGGMAVTMPLKPEVAAAVDALDPAAAALRSVNTVSPDADGARGLSSDGDGFVASLRASGHDPVGTSVLVIGAGAASRSIIDALGRAGVGSIAVVNRTHSGAVDAAQLAPMATAVEHDQLAAVAASSNIIVNTTSVGMGHDAADGASSLDVALLSADHVVADIVYHPLRTALLSAAALAGAATVDGLGMLVHQAALQVAAWTGVMPDVSVMRAAAEAELLARHG